VHALDLEPILTHVQLPHKTAHVVVFIVKRKKFIPKLSLIWYYKTSARLKQKLFIKWVYVTLTNKFFSINMYDAYNFYDGCVASFAPLENFLILDILLTE
jgi:hypothetical protein